MKSESKFSPPYSSHTWACDAETRRGGYDEDSTPTVTPEGAPETSKSVAESVESNSAPPERPSVSRALSRPASASRAGHVELIVSVGPEGVAEAASLAAPAGALARSARTWNSYARPFASPNTVTVVVPAALPDTAVHEPHEPPERL